MPPDDPHGSVPDEREIEAVADALSWADSPDPGGRVDPNNYTGLAAAAIRALDRVRDARRDDEEHDGLPGYWVCEKCGQPLGKDGRCNSGLHVGPGEEANGMAIHTTDLAALAACSPQGEDHEAACPCCGHPGYRNISGERLCGNPGCEHTDELPNA